MSHHHHDHDHNDHHHHSHDESSEMSMEDKLAKLLDHWLHHNEEHVKSYELWAERAKSHGNGEVAELILKAAEKSRSADEDFKAALTALKG